MKQPPPRRLNVALNKIFADWPASHSKAAPKPGLYVEPPNRKHGGEQRVTLGGLLPLGAALFGIHFAAGDGYAQTPFTAPSTPATTSALAGEVTLPSVSVKSNRDVQDGLRGTTTRVGKTVQDPHEIPQAITTITNQLMDQQQVGSLKEALRNVSGLTFNAAEGGRSGDNMNLRGFYPFRDLYLDGMRDTAQYNRETFNLEQIDVLRGAGAMLFGRGQAGGVINLVSKTPLKFDQYKFSASAGSYGYYEATADLNKAFSPDIGLRVNLMQRDEGAWRSNPATGTEPEVHRRGAAFSLALNQNSNSRFWLNHQTTQTKDNPDYGVSFNNATRAPTQLVPTDYYWGIDRNFDRSDASISTLVHEHRFSPQTTLRTQLRYSDIQRSYWAKTPSATTPQNALGGVGGNQVRASDYETVNLQSDFNTSFKLAGMKHEFLAGIEYLREDSHRKGLQNFGTTAAPAYYPYAEAFAGNPVQFNGESHALYVQDTIEFLPRWKATLGLRRDNMHALYNSAAAPALNYGENSYRAALSFHLNPESHFYLGWSDTFSPTADLYQLTIVPQPSERSAVVELGAKLLLMNGDLALRGALYRAIKNWERNTDLESTSAVLTKMRRTDGIELEAAGRLTNNWEIFAGATYMNARILEVAQNFNAAGVLTQGNPEYIGKRARNTPRYTVNTWTTYKLPGLWKVGGGVEMKGDREAFNPSGAGAVPTLLGAYKPNTAPAFVRVDLMGAYEEKKWALRLNIKNLLNKVYYDALYDNGAFTVPGPRRTVILTAEMKF